MGDLKDYEVYNSEEVQMEDDPISFEEAMRSEYSSKWLDAMDMKSIIAKKFKWGMIPPYLKKP
jgi:hypothetical protein